MVPGQRAGSGRAAAGVRMLRPSAGWLEGGGGRVWEKVGREVRGVLVRGVRDFGGVGDRGCWSGS